MVTRPSMSAFASVAEVDGHRLAVGDHDRDPLVSTSAEVVWPAEIRERAERRRAAGAPVGRRPLDPDRPVERRRERVRAERREEVWQHAVGERRDADPHVGELRRSSFANVRARSSRVGSVGARRASIERVMSNTTSTSTPSARERSRPRDDGLGGRRAPSSTPTATSGATSRPTDRGGRGGARARAPSRRRAALARARARAIAEQRRRDRREGPAARGTRGSSRSLEAATGGRRARAGAGRRRARRRSPPGSSPPARSSFSASSRL